MRSMVLAAIVSAGFALITFSPSVGATPSTLGLRHGVSLDITQVQHHHHGRRHRHCHRHCHHHGFSRRHCKTVCRHGD